MSELTHAQYVDEIAAIDKSFEVITDLAKSMSHLCVGRDTLQIVGAAKILIAWSEAEEMKKKVADAQILSQMAATAFSNGMSQVPGFGMEPDILADLAKIQKPVQSAARGPMNEWVKEELNDD